MVVHQAKKEIPWCTVFLVTGALVSHGLVLSGNLATARAMHVLGQSTGGWSGVGVTLSGSLHHELDVIMANVTAVLTKAIKTLNTVSTSIDAVLGIAGSVTDQSLSGYEKGMAKNGTNKKASFAQEKASSEHKSEYEALLNHSYKGPWAPSMVDLRLAEALAAPKGSFVEAEVNFMGELQQPVLNAMDPIETLASPEDFEEEVIDELLVWNRNNVERITASVTTGALSMWKAARGHAERLHSETGLAPAWPLSDFPTPREFAIALKAAIRQLIGQLAGKAQDILVKLFDLIKPALLQVGKWVTTFGDKLTDKINGFMTSLDNVQKIFDQIMAKLNKNAGQDKEQMIHQSYNLFDASHSGYISAQDLQDVGQMYGVNALQGSKADQLFEKYDADHNGKMMMDEFALFVDDPDVPNIMSTVLRYYAKMLSQIAGNVAGAKLRDEVSLAVMNYLALVCAKNMTKVAWVSNTLTNRSVPAEFSADVLVQLALNLDNPNQLTTVDVGAIIVKEMCKLNAPYVGQLLALTMDPGYFVKEGFTLTDQAKVVKRITLWVANTPFASETLAAQKHSLAMGNLLAENPTPPRGTPTVAPRTYERAFYATFKYPAQVQVGVSSKGAKEAQAAVERVEMTSEQIQEAPAVLSATVVERQKLFQRSLLIAKRLELLEKRETPTVRALRDGLGVISFGSSNVNPVTAAAINSGVPARPETLRFAHYLSNNATATANRIQELCFNYTSESSNPLDSFAVQIKNMIKKAQNFISLIKSYAGTEGVKRLESEIENFGKSSTKSIIDIIEPVINQKVDQIAAKYGNSGMSMDSIIEKVLQNWTGLANFTVPESVLDAANKALHPFAVAQVEAQSVNALGGPGQPSTSDLIANLGLGPVWSTLQYTLSVLQAALPQVVDDMKFARTEVSAVVSTLDSIFSTFEKKGPPIFDLVAKLYKMIWVIFFIVFFILTLGVLFYGMWASGFCGGPQAAADVSNEEWYERPQSFRDRCRICCVCCDSCLRGCADSHLCFWSVIVFMEIIVLVLFVISIVLCLLAGIKAFIVAGCAEIYLLGDPSICTGVLSDVKQFLLSFLAASPIPLSHQCEAKTLLTCQLIGSKLKTSAIFTVIGSLVAAVFSFQMIVESAIMHERARWRRIFDEESKKS